MFNQPTNQRFFFLAGLVILVFLCCPTPARADVTYGLIGWYKMDEASGNAVDSSGQHNDLTPNGTSIVAGCKKNGCRAFNGSTDYLNGGSLYNFTSSNFSFTFWIYLNSYNTGVGGQGPVPVYKGGYQSSGYYAQIGQDGHVSFITSQGGSNQSSLTNSGVVTTGSWTHLAFTRNGSSVRVYVNGLDATLTPASHVNPASSGDSFSIGRYLNGGSIVGTNGRIDDFRVYNRALSANEVKEIYDGKGHVVIGGRAHLSGFHVK